VRYGKLNTTNKDEEKNLILYIYKYEYLVVTKMMIDAKKK